MRACYIHSVRVSEVESSRKLQIEISLRAKRIFSQLTKRAILFVISDVITGARAKPIIIILLNAVIPSRYCVCDALLYTRIIPPIELNLIKLIAVFTPFFSEKFAIFSSFPRSFLVILKSCAERVESLHCTLKKPSKAANQNTRRNSVGAKRSQGHFCAPWYNRVC